MKRDTDRSYKHRWDLIGCEPFSNIVGGLSQEQKHIVYENNYYELQKYKKLEEELGIDPLILFKALKNGVWVEVDPADINDDNPDRMYLEKFVSLSKNLNGILYLEVNDYVDELWLSDYQKTWWLKEDMYE